MDPLAVAEYALRTKIEVTPTLVALAKSSVLTAVQAGRGDFSSIVEEVLRGQGISMPPKIIGNSAYDATSDIATAAKGFSWKIATAEALWGLIHSGHLIHMSGQTDVVCDIACTTIPPAGGGGISGGWSFREFEVTAPSRVRLAPSQQAAGNQFLTDPDLFVRQLGNRAWHADVERALRECVRCFRHELYTAALAMLGKASEGAWLELGEALLRVAGPAVAGATFRKATETLESPMTGTLKKVEAVLQMYARKDCFPSVIARCGVGANELQQAQQWSDALRDSRNTIHFGVAPATPNTYEKVSVLVLAAVPNIRTLYAIKEAADGFPPGTV